MWIGEISPFCHNRADGDTKHLSQAQSVNLPALQNQYDGARDRPGIVSRAPPRDPTLEKSNNGHRCQHAHYLYTLHIVL